MNINQIVETELKKAKCKSLTNGQLQSQYVMWLDDGFGCTYDQHCKHKYVHKQTKEQYCTIYATIETQIRKYKK